MATTVTRTPTLAEVIGGNLQAQRIKRHLSVTAFADQMRGYLGQGWARPDVYDYESGQRPMRAADLVAAALVLDCSVVDLMTSRGPVEVGTTMVGAHQLGDAVMQTGEEERGWQRFQEAAEALNEMDNAAGRYVYAMGYVRSRVAEFPPLRERIKAFGFSAEARTKRELLEMRATRSLDASGAPLPPLTQEDLTANETPASAAAHDALDASRDVDHLEWAWKVREGSGRRA
jgi:hypothetical protein